MNFIEANGVGLRYELSGSGERHGRADPRDGRQPGELGRGGRRGLPRNGACCATTRAAPGCRRRCAARSPSTPWCDDLAALMDALGITGKVALAGVAVGGAIALHAAARLPQRISAAVVGSPAIGIAADRRAAVLARVDRLEREGMRSAVDDSMANGYAPELRTDAARFAAFRARWLGNDPASYAAIYRMLAGMDLQGELAGIRLSGAGARRRSRPRPPARAGRAGRPHDPRRALPGAADRPLHVGGDAGASSQPPSAISWTRSAPEPAEPHHKLVRGQSWNRPNSAASVRRRSRKTGPAMSRCHRLLAPVVAYLLLVLPAAADKRVALVVGNSAYVHAAVLPNPVNDAGDMAKALTEVGFEVILGLDLEQAGARRQGARLRACAGQGGRGPVLLCRPRAAGIGPQLPDAGGRPPAGRARPRLRGRLRRLRAQADGARARGQDQRRVPGRLPRQSAGAQPGAHHGHALGQPSARGWRRCRRESARSSPTRRSRATSRSTARDATRRSRPR